MVKQLSFKIRLPRSSTSQEFVSNVGGAQYQSQLLPSLKLQSLCYYLYCLASNQAVALMEDIALFFFQARRPQGWILLAGRRV